MKKILLTGVLLWSFIGAGAYAADPDGVDDTPEDIKVEETEGKPLEGVVIEALETYAAAKNNELGFQFGLFPFNSYFTGFSLTGFYDYRITKNIAWEILNASYIFSINTDLTSQLAQDYNVSPQTIERLQYLVSTNFLFTHTRGKMLFLDDYIRNFSSSLILGLGLLTTNRTSEVHGVIGVAFDGMVSDTFSWRFEFRDMVTVNGRNFAYFTLGTGVNF